MKRLMVSLANRPDGPIEIVLPGSKSIANRLLTMQALSQGAIEIGSLSTADDTQLLQIALQSQGEERWMGEAGTALRFGLAWAAVTPGTHVINGSKRLSERPIAPLVDALRKLGADISYLEKEGFAPMRVRGRKLRHHPIGIDATMSSQFTSALMMIGPLVDGGLVLERLGRAVSQPYVEMTQRLLQQAGIAVAVSDSQITVQEGKFEEVHFDVESDWSAASYFYAAMALMFPQSDDSDNFTLSLPGLSREKLQGDAVVADIFAHFGVKTRFTARGAQLIPSGHTSQLERYDFVHCPDLAQTVAVVAAAQRRVFRLEGLQTLRVKETDRIAALVAELAKCGVTCRWGDDFLELVSFSDLEVTPSIATYRDHRMAMAFAPWAFAKGEVIIEEPEVVSKSFPGYWNELSKLGLALMGC